MTLQEPPRPCVGRHGLDRLLVEVNRARAALQACHRLRGKQDERQLRDDLLHALESYEAALADVGAPFPYRLRDELNLFRRLSAGR
jgi:hypothetical protein